MEQNISIDGAEITYEYVKELKGLKIVSIRYQAPNKSTYIVPSEIEGVPVRQLGVKFANGIKADTIRLPDTENTLILSAECFSCLKQIDTVIISASVDTISEGCFYNAKVKKIMFEDPSNISKIFDYAFAGTKYLHTFDWPENCLTIPEGCFEDSKIVELYGIDNVRVIEATAFRKSCIRSIHWPDGCTYIPESCFEEANKLKTLSNIEHVQEIGYRAFSECGSLKSMKWPPKCMEIPSECFSHSGLTCISGIEHVSKIGAAAFLNSKIERFVWPEKCSTIPLSCFRFSRLKEIEFSSDTIDRIEDKAFEGTEFKSLKLPTIRNGIGRSAFDGMVDLEELVLGSGQTRIPASALNLCPHLKVVVCTSPVIKVLVADICSLNSSGMLDGVVYDMTQVSELSIVDSELNDRFLKNVKVGFDTDVHITKTID